MGEGGKGAGELVDGKVGFVNDEVEEPVAGDAEEVIPAWPALERVLIARCFDFMKLRVFSLLSMTGEERYRYLQGQNPELFNQVPLKYLASMMGMTPESLSRIRKKLL